MPARADTRNKGNKGRVAKTGASVREAEQLRREAELLLYREAWLLDQHRLADWLSLYTGDATYWVPLERGQKEPFETCSLIYDDRTLLEIRVNQFSEPRAHARLPVTQTCHQVGNVMVLQAGEPQIVIASTLVVVEYRRERQRVWGATCEHRLRATPEGLRIAAKRIDLANAEAELEGIAFLF